MKWRLILIASLTCAAVVVIALWVIHSRQVGYWFQFHTGIINESGPYYGFWSGFGSDITEFGIFGAIAAGVYQLIKKYNCHSPGCWRIGNHPAAGGQFLLCYRHHPDYQGRKPTRELIERMHREHLERQAAIHGKLDHIQQQLAGKPHVAQPAGNHQADPAAASLSVPGVSPSPRCASAYALAGTGSAYRAGVGEVMPSAVSNRICWSARGRSPLHTRAAVAVSG